jgi:phosphate transport system substrate-binding protein
MNKILSLCCFLSMTAFAGTLTIKGSDTMVILTQRWAEEFMKKNPGVKIQVTGGGSGTGISALINATTEIATSSRPMKDAEQEKLRARFSTAGTEIAMAKDGLTIFVNEKNPLNAITMEQLKSIYLGDVTNWKDLGGADAPIVLYSRENSSGTYVFFKDNVLAGADFAATAQMLPGTAAVVNAVAKEKNGIGYGGAAYTKGLKALKIKTKTGDISADEASVKSGKYPLSRDLYFYLQRKPGGDAKAFIDFCLSAEGQALVTKVGYFPLK